MPNGCSWNLVKKHDFNPSQGGTQLFVLKVVAIRRVIESEENQLAERDVRRRRCGFCVQAVDIAFYWKDGQ
ncbi:hypothetical protein N7540_000899 [Penicillium herquei]|nr:hypothetical protein N7540_000899 [Penicillium herquei]